MQNGAVEEATQVQAVMMEDEKTRQDSIKHNAGKETTTSSEQQDKRKEEEDNKKKMEKAEKKKKKKNGKKNKKQRKDKMRQKMTEQVDKEAKTRRRKRLSSSASASSMCSLASTISSSSDSSLDSCCSSSTTDSELSKNSQRKSDGSDGDIARVTSKSRANATASMRVMRARSKMGASFSFKDQQLSRDLPPSLQPQRPDNFIRKRFSNADESTLPLSTRSRIGYAHAETSFKNMSFRQSSRVGVSEQSMKYSSRSSLAPMVSGSRQQSHRNNAWLLIHAGTEHSIVEEDKYQEAGSISESQGACEDETKSTTTDARSRRSVERRASEQAQIKAREEERLAAKIRESGKDLGFQSIRARPERRASFTVERRRSNLPEPAPEQRASGAARKSSSPCDEPVQSEDLKQPARVGRDKNVSTKETTESLPDFGKASAHRPKAMQGSAKTASFRTPIHDTSKARGPSGSGEGSADSPPGSDSTAASMHMVRGPVEASRTGSSNTRSVNISRATASQRSYKGSSISSMRSVRDSFRASREGRGKDAKSATQEASFRAPSPDVSRRQMIESVVFQQSSAVGVQGESETRLTWQPDSGTESKVVEADKNATMMHILHADNLRRAGKLRAALWHAAKASSLTPRSPLALLKRAQILGQIGLWSEVHRDCTRALACWDTAGPQDRTEETSGLWYSAKFLRAQSCGELDQPRHAEAVKELLELRGACMHLPGLSSRVLLALAKSKRALVTQRDRSRKESIDLLEWALEDVIAAETIVEKWAATSVTGVAPDRGPVHRSAIAEALALVHLDMYGYSHDQRHVDAAMVHSAEAYRAGLHSPRLASRVVSSVMRAGDHRRAATLTHELAKESAQASSTTEALPNEASRKTADGKGRALRRQTVAEGAANSLSPKRPSMEGGTSPHGSGRKRATMAGRKTRVSGHAAGRSSMTTGQDLRGARRDLELTLTLLRARALACTGDLVGAESGLREALKRDPSSVVAACLLAEVLGCQGQHERGQRVLADVALCKPALSTTGRALILRVRHNLYIGSGKLDEALRDLQKLNGKSQLLSALDTQEQAYCAVRYAELRLDYLRDAPGALRILHNNPRVGTGPSQAKAALVCALALLRSGEHGLAIKELGKVIYLNAGIVPEHHLLRAWCCAAKERLAESICDLTIFCRATFANEPARRDLLLQRLHVIASDAPQEALDLLRKSCVTDARAETLLLFFQALTKVAIHNKDPLHAYANTVADLIAEIREATPLLTSQLAAAAASCLHKVGRLAEADELYALAMSSCKARSPGETAFRQRLNVNRGACQAQLAVGTVKRSVKSGKPVLDAFAAASKSWSSAGENDPLALVHLGDLHMFCGEPRNAASFYARAISGAPSIGVAAAINVRRGCALAKLKQHGHALEALNEAVQADSVNTVAWYNLGVMYEQVGKMERASDAYSQALAGDASYHQARARKAVAQIHLGRLDEALVELDRLRDTPADGFLTSLLAAHCCVVLAQFERALGYVAQPLKDGATLAADARAALRLVEGAARTGLCQRDLSQFARMARGEVARSASPEIPAADKRAVRLARARAALTEAVYLDPARQAHARINLGLCEILAVRGLRAQANFEVAAQMLARGRLPPGEPGEPGHALQKAVAGLALSHLLHDEALQAHVVLEAFACPPEAQDEALRIAQAVTLHANGCTGPACEMYETLPALAAEESRATGYAAEVGLLAAAAALRHRKPSRAQALMSTILQRPQLRQHVACRLVLSIALIMQEQVESAARILESSRPPLVRDQSRQFYLLFNRATIHGQLGNAWQSLRDCEEALRLDPGAIALKLLKAHMLVHQHRTRDALDAFQEVLDADDALLAVISLQT